ncbi:hypothetical protein [Gilliamella sp. Nev3-1]|uniref:hypothetical protein n=1 Tax=Gilliamella sp. Nev3-1 TaxID=3120250 RepID=UPI00080E2C29|nr:hypothetical protein [Gilliamella apicola]OCG59325.1 hypothetical protein A9G40_07070 [Gilliamella apicola]
MAQGTRHKAQGTRQVYVLNLSNNPIRRVFARNSFISSKLSIKLFSKIPLALALLLLLPYSLESQALSATTSDRIHGTAPYLTFDGGVTKVTKTDDLLTIKLSDGRTFTPQNNPSSPTVPIELPNIGDTLANIDMIAQPADSVSLNDLVAQGKWGDDDGDNQVTAMGHISVSFADKNSNTISRRDALDICKAPYKITLSSTVGSLATQYGVPKSSTFSEGTAVYYITPPSQPVICSVRPNLLYGGTTGIDSNDNPIFAGPSSIWSPIKGFLTQSTSSSSYDLNFPTTGAHNLYFDLLISGVDINELKWEPVTHEGITATVTNVVPNDRWIPNLDKGKAVARVKLTGPEARNQWSNPNPNRIAKPRLPKTFELVGKDRSNNVVVRYGFVLKQWFVNRGGKYDTAPAQTTWCSRLGYRLSQIRDLTNAVRTASVPISGATPSSADNNYQRRIGAGFFTEWGYMSHYADADFAYSTHSHYGYWMSNAISNRQFYIYSDTGYVNSNNIGATFGYYAVCTAP